VRKGVRIIPKSRGNIEVAIEVEKATQLNPDLIILDVAMPVLDGFSAAERIKRTLPNLPILMFSMHDGPSKLPNWRGFVTKNEDASVLLNAVDALLRGENSFPDNDRLESINPSSLDSA
jgi:DNA-binding NarL/FixJ family response regulator